MAVHGIETEVSGRVEGALDDVFELFREIDVTTILTGMGPLPAVTSVSNPTGRWDAPGLERVLHLSDGSSLREHMNRIDAPHGFSYDLDQITGPLRFLVHSFHGRWSFESDGRDGPREFTRASWHYLFEPHSRLTWFPAALIVHLLWRPYMARVLERAAAQAALEHKKQGDHGRVQEPVRDSCA